MWPVHAMKGVNLHCIISCYPSAHPSLHRCLGRGKRTQPNAAEFEGKENSAKDKYSFLIHYLNSLASKYTLPTNEVVRARTTNLHNQELSKWLLKSKYLFMHIILPY